MQCWLINRTVDYNNASLRYVTVISVKLRVTLTLTPTSLLYYAGTYLHYELIANTL